MVAHARRNHLHLVLRTLPRVAKRWTAEDVVRRWLTITRLAKCFTDDVPAPDPQRVEQLARNKKLVAKLRGRLSSISWFMGILCENIARRANKEDDCKGRFFETRFSCRECADLNGILLCGIYVDLNPYRAGEVDNPVGSPYTSVYQRLQAQGRRKNAADRPDRWLAELTLPPERKADEAWAYSS
ncbi:MAG: transposase, partial [Pirellulaceae bacterium]